MKKIKFFYGVPEYFPAWRLDVSHLFGEQLSKRGLDISWCMWRDTKGPYEVLDSQNGQEINLPLSFGRNRLWNRILNRFSYVLCELPLFAKMVMVKYDVIQARDLRYSMALLGLVAARLTGAKFTYWLSYPFPEHYLEMSSNKRGLARLIRLAQGTISFWFVYKWLMHRADHVFVQSEQMKEDVANYGVTRQKMTSVPMGVPPALLRWKQNNSNSIVAGRIVYVGTLASIRKLEMLIEAFSYIVKKNDTATLVMVGDGDVPSEKEFLEAEALRLGVADRITFTGFIAMEEAWDYAASAAVCVSPFYPTFVLRSTSPTKLNEYFALGRPVVANDHPEQSTAIAESGAGICVPWGAKEFSDAIQQLLDDPLGAEKMAAKGPGWVRKNRSYDGIADDVISVYRDILKNNE